MYLSGGIGPPGKAGNFASDDYPFSRTMNIATQVQIRLLPFTDSTSHKDADMLLQVKPNTS